MATQTHSPALSRALVHLARWRRAQDHPEGRCLEAVRLALRLEGLSLPGPFARPDNTALGCFAALAETPERWGWRRWTHREHPDEAMGLCLVFFKDCGRLADGRIAGHVAFYNPSKRRHEANQVYAMTMWWAERLIGAFVPAG